MAHAIRSIQDVVDWRLCMGCGACQYACPHHLVRLEDIVREGLRPRVQGECGECRVCLDVCPGLGVQSAWTQAESSPREAARELGRPLEIWEGYAADAEIRFRASSGGALTALCLYCLEQEAMSQVLHTAADEKDPWRNRTVQSTTREELLARSGSRYAPSSPCEGLAALEEAARPGVFVGKPCDAAAVAALRKTRPALDRNLGLVLTFFCAGVPSTEGTLDLIHELGQLKAEVSQVRYRGRGWPGGFELRRADGVVSARLSYRASWAKLTSYRALRCKLCPDGMGELADVACGDAWRHQDGTGANPGMSLLLVRTERGREMVRRAVAAGYLVLRPVTDEDAAASQPSLLQKRRELYGRLAGLRALCIPVPRLEGFALRESWRELAWTRRWRTLAGTLQRAMRNGWWRRGGERA
ncbi:MAG: Coenzyme F420 hydrogenase/dehydrogenase, beta subunit C-terminal domain [Acidobacteriota bacterium]|nr:Coenzyme F420 hydrogenase/dehydrogenase, beta subunit C-terminal domain [Acidobacteriota bacterium]